MKTLRTASIALIASAGAALAADTGAVITPGPFSPPPAFPARQQPTVTPGPFDPPPAFARTNVYDWTGFYVGINGGGAFGISDWSSVPDLTSGRSDISGGQVGGTAGYNLQTGEPYVLGVEADLDWSSVHGTASPASCAPNCEIKNPWLATVRLRFGYAFGAFMPYASGGVAIGRLDANIVGTPFGTDGETNLGWTAGAGLEVALWGPLRAKVEYLHVDLNGFSCGVACAGASGGPISFNVNDNIIRAGLNYRLWTQ
ncbi:MAG TPA: outer membrane protein [Xanthobacteraceae bacterium]|nr:outer membrane protein [Xanthobacteraceae bacterium]